MFKTVRNLIIGPNYPWDTVYNGVKFKTRIRQFFRRKQYKSGQVVGFKGIEYKLTRFVRYNNVFSELWEYQCITFPNIAGELWLDNTDDNKKYFGIGE